MYQIPFNSILVFFFSSAVVGFTKQKEIKSQSPQKHNMEVI